MSGIQKIDLGMPKAFAEAALKAAGIVVDEAPSKLVNRVNHSHTPSVAADYEGVKNLFGKLSSNISDSFVKAEKPIESVEGKQIPVPGDSLSHRVKKEGLTIKDAAFVCENTFVK